MSEALGWICLPITAIGIVGTPGNAARVWMRDLVGVGDDAKGALEDVGTGRSVGRD